MTSLLFSDIMSSHKYCMTTHYITLGHDGIRDNTFSFENVQLIRR